MRSINNKKSRFIYLLYLLEMQHEIVLSIVIHYWHWHWHCWQGLTSLTASSAASLYSAITSHHTVWAAAVAAAAAANDARQSTIVTCRPAQLGRVGCRQFSWRRRRY